MSRQLSKNVAQVSRSTPSSTATISLLLFLTVASQPIEIPCNTDPSVVYSVQSHRDYTLTGCFPASVGVAPGVSIAPDATAVVGGVLVLRNVSLTVMGGGVLPLLTVSGSSVLMEGVTILLTGVRVGPHVYNRTQQQLSSMVSILFVSSPTMLLHKLVVSLEDCMIHITSMNNANAWQPSALLQIQAGPGPGTVEDISVAFRNCNMSLYLDGGQSGNARGSGFVSISLQNSSTISNLTAQFSNTSAILIGDISQVVVVNDVNPAMVNLLCGGLAANFSAENVTMTSFNTTLIVRQSVLAFALRNRTSPTVVSSPETVSVLSLLAFYQVKNVVFEALNCVIVVSCSCTVLCDAPSVSALNAGVAWFSGAYVVGGENTAVASDVSVLVARTSLELDAPCKTNIVTASFGALGGGSVVATVTNCKFSSINAGQNIGSQPRFAAIMAAYNNVLATNWTIQIQGVVFLNTQESGRCLGTLHSAVYFIGDIANIDVTLVNVTMVTAAVNGTAVLSTTIPRVALAMMTTTSALVSLQPAALTTGSDGTNVHITVTNCGIAAEHTPRLPTGASMFTIASLVCGVSIAISLSTSTVTLHDVHIERHFARLPASTTWFPANPVGFRVNISSVAQFIDVTASVPATLAPFMAIFTGGASAPVQHINVTVSLQGNCTVAYHSVVVAPLTTDRIAFIQFPNVVNQSKYSLHGTLYRSLLPTSDPVNVGFVFGSLAAATGSTQLVDSSVSVSDVVAPMANLLTAFNGKLQLLSSNKGLMIISFSTTTLQRSIVSINAPLLLAAYEYVAGAVDGSIVVVPPYIAGRNELGFGLLSSAMSIENCSFVGFTSLVEASALNLSLYNDPDHRLVYFLHLGCNLWNDVAMPLSAVSTDAMVLRLVDYRRSACVAALTQSITSTETDNTEKNSAPRPHLHFSAIADISAATMSGAVAVYAAVLVPVAQARSVAGLQRAIATMRLSARCAASAANATYADPMFSQLVDNPLGLPVAVGADALRYAGGAAVDNALLALALAVLMHLLHFAKGRGAFITLTLLAPYLPSSRLPGSAAMPFGKLVLPAVGACMALLVSSERTVRSAVCGGMMLVVWVAYPAYCCGVILVRGRCGGVFVLRSDAVREKRSTELNALREAVDFVTEPTHEWVAARVAGPREREHAILLLRHMEPVFEAYVGRREWYFAVEWAFAMLSGAVLGAAEAVASNSGGANACVAAQWGVGCAVGLSALQLVMCLWLRPFAVRLELWMALLLGGLELVGNALSLGDETAAAGVVVSVSAYLELVVGVLLPILLFVLECRDTTRRSEYRRNIREAIDKTRFNALPIRSGRNAVGPSLRRDGKLVLNGIYQEAQLRGLLEIICRERRH